MLLFRKYFKHWRAFLFIQSSKKKATFYSKGISTGNVYNIRNYMVTSVTDHKIKLLALVNGKII